MELERKALPWTEKAKALKITDQMSYTTACEELLAVKQLLKEAEDHHRPIISAANQTHKLACAALNKVNEPLQAAERAYKQSIANFETEQKRLEEAERRRLEAAAVEQSQNDVIAEAVEAAEYGASETEVEAILTQPVAVPVPVVQPAFERAKGVSTTYKYSAEVVNLRELCRAVADGKISPSFVEANMTVLNAQARSLKETFSVPGCRVRKESTVRAGGR